jgi:hypothetical protein
MTEPTVYIGYDSREEIAYDVCKHSIDKRASKPVEIYPLKQQALRDRGLYQRDKDPLASTEFTYTRFMVPFLRNYEGFSVFVDCDFLFLADIWELLDQFDPKYAVQCVHHDYNPTEKTKMDGAVQTAYPRKNWSSLMIWNNEHPKNKVLTTDCVNSESGAFLHRFQWLADEDIGELSYLWNFLEGWYDPVDSVKAVHYTRGGPWFENWQDVDYGKEWLEEKKAFESGLDS